MDAGRVPNFAEMYSGYFHEDWRLDDTSADEVVRRYRRVTSQEEVNGLTKELTGLLTSHLSEPDLRAGSVTKLRPRRRWAEC